MNHAMNHVIKVECPKCKQPIGKICLTPNRTLKSYCFERLTLANIKFPPKLLVTSEPKVFRNNTLRNCRQNHHDKCSGGKKNHGVITPCGCACHRQKEKISGVL